MPQNTPDIIITLDTDPNFGLLGRVTKNERCGVSARLENGAKIRLKNHQFDYCSEFEDFPSQSKKKV